MKFIRTKAGFFLLILSLLCGFSFGVQKSFADTPVTGVSLNESDASLSVGDTDQLTAIITPADATDQNVTWSSSDANIAAVKNTGFVTAVGVGSATITVTTEDGNFTATDNITVSQSLANEKTSAHGILTLVLSTYTAGDYTIDNFVTLSEFKTIGDTAIDDAVNLAEINSAETTAINGMAGVQTASNSNRYWVGGIGNWSDTNHWSMVLDGPGGASVPTSSDNAFIDSDSVTLTGNQTVSNIKIFGGEFNTSGYNFAVLNNFIQISGNVIANPSGVFTVGGSFFIPGPGMEGTFSRFSGSGILADPYMIYDIYGLQAMNGFLSSNFKLVNNINAAGTNLWEFGIRTGFSPVGNNFYKFTGTFDGNGKLISSLYISIGNLPNLAQFVGLFGYTAESANIKNVGIENCFASTNGYVGCLVGFNSGTINESYVYSASIVAADWGGGLVGTNIGVINNSYAVASVILDTGDSLGGLVGSNGGSISNSYSRGTVLGGRGCIGGLAGCNLNPYVNFYSSESDGTIENSFSTANVTQTIPTGNNVIQVGGLAGDFSVGSVVNSYFTDSNHDNGLGSLETGGPTTFFGSSHNHAVYANWDFTDVWSAFDNTYPHLKWENYSTSSKSITSFNLNGLSPNVKGVINDSNKTIALAVPYGTDITALIPTITTSDGSSIMPADGEVQNFTNPVIYSVTAVDSTIQEYLVTVTMEFTHITGISLNESNSSLEVGGTDQLIASFSPTNASNQNVTWSSSDDSIATVDSSSGQVTAVAPGSATITVTTEDGNFTATDVLTINPVPARSLYWVGGTGNWSDTNHWSLTSGGTSGVDVPTDSDNVFIDSNSGLGSGTETITLDTDSVMKDFTSDSGSSYTITGNQHFFNVYGSLALESGLSFNLGDNYSLDLLATTTGKTITTNGCNLVYLLIEGVGGGWTLEDDLTLTGPFEQTNGIFNANNKNITATDFSFYADTGYTPTVTMGSGTWEATGNDTATFPWQVYQSSNQVVTFTPGTSTIKFTDTSTENKSFSFYDSAGTETGKTYNNVWFAGAGSVSVSGSNTFNDLKIDPGESVQFTDGTTQTVNTLTATGTSGAPITLGGTSTGGWGINKTSGTVSDDYLNISYSTAGGGATFYAGGHSTDGGNNSGWIFTAPPEQNTNTATYNNSGGGYYIPLTTKTPTIIQGCDSRTTGFSITTGKSCIGNTGTTVSTVATTRIIYNFSTATLKNGSRGEAVKELQRFLNKALNLNLVVDGKLGPKTLTVIKIWQKQNGLIPDGFVGPKTKEKMNASIK